MRHIERTPVPHRTMCSIKKITQGFILTFSLWLLLNLNTVTFITQHLPSVYRNFDMNSPNCIPEHNNLMKHQVVFTLSLLVILVVSFDPAYFLSAHGQTSSHTRSHIGMNEHSSDQQQTDQHHMHKQMLDTNAFSDLSRNTTSSGIKTDENTNRTG